MKKSLLPVSIIIQAIISLVIGIVGYNLNSTSSQNLLFFLSLILCTAFWTVIFFIKKEGTLKGAAIGFAGICIIISLLNFYTVLNSNFGWSRNAAFNKVEKDVQASSQLVYETQYTKLYIDTENKKLYSISDIGTDTGKYFYQTNLSKEAESEYITLYSEGIPLKSLSKDISEISIHPTTISTLTGYEQLIEVKIDEEVFVAPTFFVGKMQEVEASFDKIADIHYGEDAIQNYEVYKMNEGTLFIQNNLGAFVSPYVNVMYNPDVKFQNRYVEYMRNFNESYELPTNLSFGLAQTIEVNGEEIERISFYYEIYNLEYQGSLLMEIAYKDGTADVAYVKEMYSENLTSAKEA